MASLFQRGCVVRSVSQMMSFCTSYGLSSSPALRHSFEIASFVMQNSTLRSSVSAIIARLMVVECIKCIFFKFLSLSTCSAPGHVKIPASTGCPANLQEQILNK